MLQAGITMCTCSEISQCGRCGQEGYYVDLGSSN